LKIKRLRLLLTLLAASFTGNEPETKASEAQSYITHVVEKVMVQEEDTHDDTQSMDLEGDADDATQEHNDTRKDAPAEGQVQANAKNGAAERARLALANELRTTLQKTQTNVDAAAAPHSNASLSPNKKRKLDGILMKIREAKRQRNTEALSQLRNAAAKLLRNKKRNITATKTKIHRKK
jgi:hypothetical protein